MTIYPSNRLKWLGRPFRRIDLKMHSELNFESGTDRENVGCVDLGSAGAWPCYWSPYIVAGYRFVNATMDNEGTDKKIVLEELKIIQSKVENECLPDKTDYFKLLTWRPPPLEFLTTRLPTLEAAHLEILVDFYIKYFVVKATRFSNEFLCRMAEMINFLDPYLAREEKDLVGTPFENVDYALADERFDELKVYCEQATKDKKIIAKIYE